MSMWSRIKAAVLNNEPLAIPQIRALGNEFYGLDDPRLAEFLRLGQDTSTGMHVNERAAMKNSAINRAVRLICSSCGMLPVHLFEKTTQTFTVPAAEEGGTPTTETREVAVKAKDHPVHKVLHQKPNTFQTPFDFKTYMFGRAIFDGICYAYKQYKIDVTAPGGRRLIALIPLDPKKVEAKLNDQWEMEFIWRPQNGPERRILWQDMFWFRSPFSHDGITGLKLVEVAAEAIGLSMQAERTAGRVLKNGAIVGGVLEHPKALDEPAIDRLRNQFNDRQASPENAGKWIVAEEGMKVAAGAGGTTLKDAQAAELRKFQAEEVGRFLDIPRPLLMLDETSWGTGIEQLGLFLITYCLMPWFIQFEEAVTRSLLTEAEQGKFFAKFNEGALLRGSLKDQAEFFAKALGSGGGRAWMTQNEVRDKFNQEPKEGGDELPQPIQPSAKEGDKSDDSEGKSSGGGT